MNSLIESLNTWGERFADVAFPIFWQSSLLIALVFGLDWLLRRKIQPAVRYAFWLVVMVKLMLPPSLALPTAPVSWLRMRKPVSPPARTQIMTATYGPSMAVETSSPPVLPPPPPPKLTVSACAMLASAFASVLLAAWSGLRWRKINRCVRKTIAPPETIFELSAQTRRKVSLRRNVTVRLTTETMSPAVCGLWRPIILLPQSLIDKLSPEQIRAVLLHELVHVRRRDVWINCLQMLLQIIYWWHPFVWFANARIRRVREEAVDDAVMLALNDEAEIYAPTLLEVAKLAFHHPLAGLGIIGILESRTALRHRIERLLNFKTPGRAGLSAVWILALTAFTAVAVPMGEAPDKPALTESVPAPHAFQSNPSQTVVNSPGTNLAIPQSAQSIEYTRSLIHGKSLFERGKLDDSWDVFQRVLSSHPDDQFALYYLSLIKQARARKAMDSQRGPDAKQLPNQILPATNVFVIKPGGTNEPQVLTAGADSLALPIPNLNARTNVIYTNPARQKIFQKLNIIALDQISFTNATLAEVVSILNEQTTRHDPDNEGVLFTIDKQAKKPGTAEMNPSQVKIDLRPELKNVRLLDVLEAITKSSDGPIEYSIQDDGIAFSFRGVEVGPLHTRAFKIDTNALYTRLDQLGLHSTNALELIILNSFAAAGINLGPPKSVFYNDHQRTITVRGTPHDLTQTEQVLAVLNGKSGAVTGGMTFDDLNRTEQQLSMDSRTPATANPTPNVDAVTGSPITPQTPELQARTFLVDSNALYSRMDQLKPYSTEAAGQILLKYLQAAGISFPPPKALFFNDREWTLTVHGTPDDLNRAEQAFAVLNGQSGSVTVRMTGDDLNQTERLITKDEATANSIQDAKSLIENGKMDEAWEILQKILSTHPDNQAALYYSALIKQARSGKRMDGTQGSTPQNQPLITRTFKLDESTLSQNFGPIKSPKETQSALTNLFQKAGIDLSSPKSFFFNDRVGTLTVRATTNDLEMLEQIITTMNIVPPQVTIKARFVEVDAGNSGIDSGIKSLLNEADKTNGWTGILTAPRFAEILKALEKRKGASVLNEGEVTTLSGRQANFQIADIKTLVTGLNTTVTTNQTIYGYKTDAQPFGSTLDVVPNVGADGVTISMTVIPKVTEFLGYEDPKELEKYDEKLKHAPLPLPKSRVRQTTTAATIFDGQTLVIGNLSDQIVFSEPNKAELRQSYTNKKKKRLLVFITATIIDRAGNRVHSRDYYDFPVVY